MHFFNPTVELYSTDSPAFSFKTHTDAAIQAPPPICSAAAGEKLNICRRQLQEGFQKKKTPQTANIHLPPCRELARAQCQHKRFKSSRPQFFLILLRPRRNEYCFPKRQTSFVISSSFFFFFLCVRNSKLSSKMASQGWKNVT